jgi:hypothetical protein
MSERMKTEAKWPPGLWAELAQACREDIGLATWSDDDLKAVMSKVIAPEPDLVLDHIARVLTWCAKAEEIGGDTLEVATVDLWKDPDMPIEITVDEDGEISHRLAPGASVEPVVLH